MEADTYQRGDLVENRVFVRRKGKKKIYSLNSDTVKPILDLAEKHVMKYCKHRATKSQLCSAAGRT